MSAREREPPFDPELLPDTVYYSVNVYARALVAAETMTGLNGNVVYALPHDRLGEILRKYNRWKDISQR